jgi:alcohol dehydrogenase YqhD (iron-dependent ADH family)
LNYSREINDKTDLFDENVMNQEVEKFKQNTKRIFDYKLTEEQRIIRQKIAELQAKLI